MAEADWGELKRKIGKKLERSESTDVKDAITYLTNDPPWIQKVIGKGAEFQKPETSSKDLGVQAIEASKTVRNNLFHGGKCRPQPEKDRDPKLIQHSTAILNECLNLDPSLKSSFCGNNF